MSAQRRVDQARQARDVFLEGIRKAITLGDEGAILVGGPDSSIRCAPHEHPKWQIEGDKGSRHHQWSARPRTAKNEYLFILHVETHFARSGAVINPSENGKAFTAHDFVEAANCFVHGVRVWFGNYSISQITHFAGGHC